MKTWEVIKMLSENPKLKFVTGHFNYLGFDCKNVLSWGDCLDDFKHHKPGREFNIINKNNVKNLNLDWELVKEPVHWKDAIEAWLDGKKVYFMDNNKKYSIHDGSFAVDYINDEYVEINSEDEIITKRRFKRAEWYIEE